MAKAGTPDRAALARQAEQVRLVRSRYAQALAFGYDASTAARMANEKGNIIPPAAPPPPAAYDVPSTQTVSINGSASKPEAEVVEAAMDNIPPNWVDLPWPDLVELATRLNAGRFVKSRAHAISVIEKALVTEK